ncbi:MAG: DUF6775 family putative metallopeptidase [Candidatus Nitrosopumilus sp. Bin_571-38]|jgi:hypothetical protein
MKISKIILYNEPTVPEIQIEKIKQFIIAIFQIRVEIKDNFFKNLEDKVFEKIASAQIFDLKKQFKKHIPTQKEIQIEKENIDTSEQDVMILYDGFELQNIISENISITDDTLHIIFTNKLTATFDNDDFRYHARALISSNPIIISTTGIIEAPAKPKQYYLDLLTNFSEGKIEEIKEKYKGEFLEYHDSRLNEIAEGYVLQAILYYGTGEAFCEKKECRLFNAHWQKDLFYSQIENKKLCNKHQENLKKLRNQI